MTIIDFPRFFGFRMAPSWLKLAEKWNKYAPKLALTWSKLAQVDPSWLQVGPKLVPRPPICYFSMALRPENGAK